MPYKGTQNAWCKGKGTKYLHEKCHLNKILCTKPGGSSAHLLTQRAAASITKPIFFSFNMQIQTLLPSNVTLTSKFQWTEFDRRRSSKVRMPASDAAPDPPGGCSSIRPTLTVLDAYKRSSAAREARLKRRPTAEKGMAGREGANNTPTVAHRRGAALLRLPGLGHRSVRVERRRPEDVFSSVEMMRTLAAHVSALLFSPLLFLLPRGPIGLFKGLRGSENPRDHRNGADWRSRALSMKDVNKASDCCGEGSETRRWEGSPRPRDFSTTDRGRNSLVVTNLRSADREDAGWPRGEITQASTIQP